MSFNIINVAAFNMYNIWYEMNGCVIVTRPMLAVFSMVLQHVY